MEMDLLRHQYCRGTKGSICIPKGKSELWRQNSRVELVHWCPENMDVPIAQDETHPTILKVDLKRTREPELFGEIVYKVRSA